MKDGLKTTEFWLTILTAALGVLKATCCPDIPTEAFFASVSYVLGRSWVKAHGTKA